MRGNVPLIYGVDGNCLLLQRGKIRIFFRQDLGLTLADLVDTLSL